MEKLSEIPGPAEKSSLSTDPWEAAYLRFETPEEEIQKFIARLTRLGAPQWPRDAEIVELFCGRGNGLIALDRLGFTRIEGVDLSPRLIAQGGLHHLPALPDDLDQTFSEMQRVLRTSGRIVFVEPWRTPFLTFVHFVSELRLVRRLSNKMDAFATMTEYERRTYEQWIGKPELIKKIARAHFAPVHESFAWGKWNFVGTPR